MLWKNLANMSSVLDTSIITSNHLIHFGATFIAVYGILWVLLRSRVPLLRSVTTQPNVYYAGSIVLGAVALAAYWMIQDPWLRAGLLGASFLTLLIGTIDENRPLTASTQLVWQIVIASCAVAWGWSITSVSNLTGEGVILLDLYHLGNIALPAAIVTVGWLLLLMNALNWLDGVDGSAAGVGFVALGTLAVVSLLPSIHHAATFDLALIGAGGVLGFLLWNFAPARVYLGTSGSWFLGLYIGLIAIMSGGKIVTTLLVLALPVIDAILVIIQRLVAGQVPWRGDTTYHLHHRLRARGWRDRSIALLVIGITVILGVGAIILQTQYKIIAFVIAATMLLLIAIQLARQTTNTPAIENPSVSSHDHQL